jgi:methylthioribose-1-phosphate isomerase
MIIKTLKWVGGVDGYLEIIDQRKLPGEYKTLRCSNVKQLYDAIKTLAVRGAPAIGVAGAYGAVLALQKNIYRRARGDLRDKYKINSANSAASAVKVLKRDSEYLASSRPTAVNLRWAIERVVKCAENRGTGNQGIRKSGTIYGLRKVVLKEANVICREDVEMCRKIGVNGARFVTRASSPWKHGQDGRATVSILTHCNAGALATAGQGTALSVLYEAKKRGKKFRVFVDETRPLLQGARLTAWELKRAKIDTTVICDNMAAALMRAGKIDMVITGADRIASNGDAANKTGTYGLSVLAKAHHIPFYIAAPSSTFDLKTKTGKDIPIEQRSADEVRLWHGLPARGNTASPQDALRRMAVLQIVPDGVNIYNPAFDVTPAENITAIITERGVIEKPNAHKIAKHLA